MSNTQKYALTGLRISLGWLFLYAGISKIINPDWSAAFYLTKASSFPDFYNWLASSTMLPIVNFINMWGLLLIGIALIVGICVNYAAGGGIGFMVLYYFPILAFPHVGEHSLLVDDHIIYALALVVLIVFNAGN